MGTGWQPDDYELIRQARSGDHSFLEDLDSSHFAQREPILLIACPDYRRHYDKMRHIAQLRGYGRDEDHRTHSLNWHGGIIRLVPDFPGNTPQSAEVFLNELGLGVEVTSIVDTVGHIHWPCGMLLRNHVTLKQAFAGLMEAKRIAKKAIPGIKVRTVVQSDYADLEPHGMKSYFARPQRFQGWLTQTTPQTA